METFSDKFDDFWSVNKKLMDTSKSKLFYIPMRFYLVIIITHLIHSFTHYLLILFSQIYHFVKC